jgi:hypothetical protein
MSDTPTASGQAVTDQTAPQTAGPRVAAAPPRPPRRAMTAQQRSRRARIAAHASWAVTADRKARTASGTAAFLARFERQVDPDGVLPAEVRQVMAMHARTAYMLGLAERSAVARRRRSAAQELSASPLPTMDSAP